MSAREHVFGGNCHEGGWAPIERHNAEILRDAGLPVRGTHWPETSREALDVVEIALQARLHRRGWGWMNPVLPNGRLPNWDDKLKSALSFAWARKTELLTSYALGGIRAATELLIAMLNE